MERTQSFQDLSTVPHNLRDTVGRQNRRAAQAAAPHPNPTRLTLPNPNKISENIPPFSILNPSPSSAVSTAVGAPTQDVSRIQPLKQSPSPPPRPPPPNFSQSKSNQARSVEDQPHQAISPSTSA